MKTTFDVVLVWGKRATPAAIEGAGRVPCRTPAGANRLARRLLPASPHGRRPPRPEGLRPSRRADRDEPRAAGRELEAAGYPRERIHDVPCGVPSLPPRTQQTQADARELLADANTMLHLAEAAPLVVSTTRLSPGRGWERRLAAWSIVTRQKSAARLWLAGESPQAEAIARAIRN